MQDGVDMLYIKKLETKTLYRCADARVRVISFAAVKFNDRYVGEAVHLIPLLNVFEHD